MDPSLVGTIAGVSGLLGLLSLLAYFFITQPQANAPLQVHGQVITDQVLAILKNLKSDKAKVQYLTTHYQYSSDTAQQIVDKAKQFNPNFHAQNLIRSNDRRYLITGVLFVIIALLGTVYAITQPKTTSSVDPVLEAKKVSDPVLKQEKIYEWRWMNARPDGTPYSQVFSVQTQNRHKDSPVGISRTIRADQISEPPGATKRIISANYSCSGVDNRCGYSKNFGGTYEGQYEIAPDKSTLTWHRSWDGDPVDELYTVFYEVRTNVCTNC